MLEKAWAQALALGWELALEMASAQELAQGSGKVLEKESGMVWGKVLEKESGKVWGTASGGGSDDGDDDGDGGDGGGSGDGDGDDDGGGISACACEDIFQPMLHQYSLCRLTVGEEPSAQELHRTADRWQPLRRAFAGEIVPHHQPQAQS